MSISNLQATSSVTFVMAMAAVAVLAAVAAVASSPTTRDGVFTPEQVTRGKAVYEKSCINCHPAEFFRDRLTLWENKPVTVVFESISAAMPQDNPGSLLTSEYIDVLAYIFSITGSPTGSKELTTDTMDGVNVAAAGG
jgi:mono/diheme cytochrome c family protein